MNPSGAVQAEPEITKVSTSGGGGDENPIEDVNEAPSAGKAVLVPIGHSIPRGKHYSSRPRKVRGVSLLSSGGCRGGSDSGKENDEVDCVVWRGSRSRSRRTSRPRSGHLADNSTTQQGKLQNEFNKAPTAVNPPQSPESSLCNPLQKLKVSSPMSKSKSSTKVPKVNKRQLVPQKLQASPTATQQAQVGSKPALALAASSSHKVTEYVPIRRSGRERKPKAERQREQNELIQARLQANDDVGQEMEVAYVENKGRGVKVVRGFLQGEFVVEYAGPLIDIGTAKDLEETYSMDTSKGCYMYYFKYKGKQYCVDATGESGRFGRLVNHSRISPNCITKVVALGETPRLILVARQDIEVGTELLFDYGDRSKESLKAHPWLAL